ALRRRQLRPGGADACPDLLLPAVAGRGRGRTRAAPRRSPAADQPGPARAPRRGRGLWPRQPGISRQGAAPFRREGRAGNRQPGNGHPRAPPTALRSAFADREQAMNTHDSTLGRRWLHPQRVAALEAALRERILVIDGAMGTMIQQHGLEEADYRGERFAAGYDLHAAAATAPDGAAANGHAHHAGCDHAPQGHDLKGNNDPLLLSRPELIAGIHRAYLEAGADLVETNTFNATAISQADYHLQHLVYELNRAGARVARLACDEAAAATGQPRFVIGVLGPTSRTASISPDVNDPGFRNTSFDELRDTYAEAVEGLVDGGADTLMVETIFDTLNAKAALYAIEDV